MSWLQKAEQFYQLIPIRILYAVLGVVLCTICLNWLSSAMIAIPIHRSPIYMYPDNSIYDKMVVLLSRIGLASALALNLASLYFLWPLLPAWSILTSLIIIIMYSLDKIPYQHIWNPSVRELYPYRQWRMERATMKLLHLTQMIPKSRLLGPASMIPTEIWSLILDYALEIPFFYDTSCEAKHFNLFMSAQLHSMRYTGYDTIGRQRKVIRAVCQVWRSLADQCDMRCFGRHTRSKRISPQLKRVDLDLAYERNPPVPHYESFLEAMVKSPNHISSITTLVLYHSDQDHINALTNVFLHKEIVPRSQALSSLRSLLFPMGFWFPKWVLRDIQRSFSHLTFLLIDGPTLNGTETLFLEELDILHLDVGQSDGFPVNSQTSYIHNWKFPRLHHLVLGRQCTKHMTVDGQIDLSLIPAPPEQILSLVLLTNGEYPEVRANSSFWSQVSSLQFLGIHPMSIEVIAPAPFDHPLVHFCIPDTHGMWRRVPGVPGVASHHKYVTDIVHGIPTLKYLTIPPGGSEIAAGYTREWRGLFLTHQSKGIKWLNASGEVIKGVKREEREQEFMMLTMITTCYGYMVGLALVLAWLESPTFTWSLLMYFWSPWPVMILFYYLWTVYDS